MAMIAKHYGKNYTVQKLREICSATRSGVSLLGISDAAEKLGFSFSFYVNRLLIITCKSFLYFCTQI